MYTKYTPEEKTELAKLYTPDQLKAIEAGEAAIDFKDLSRARVRDDVLRPTDLDRYAFSRIQPVIDKKPSRMAGEGMDYDEVDHPESRYVEDHDEKFDKIGDIVLDPASSGDQELDSILQEIEDDQEYDEDDLPVRKQSVDDPVQRRPVDPNRQDVFASMWRSLEANYKGPLGQNESNFIPGHLRSLLESKAHDVEVDIDEVVAATEKSLGPLKTDPNQPRQLSTVEKMRKVLQDARSDNSPSVAPAIPPIRDPQVRFLELQDSQFGDDETGVAWDRTAKVTGIPIEQLRRFRTKTLTTHYVTNQTRLGKISSMYCLVCAGDERGMLGIGEGKSAEVDEAMRQATLNAIRAMVPIRRYEDRTIYGTVEAKVGAVQVVLRARPPGFGLRVSSHIFEMARCAGLSDLSAKVSRSHNPMNVAKAVWEALKDQRDPEDVARARGKKFVDLRKVYYSDGVY